MHHAHFEKQKRANKNTNVKKPNWMSVFVSEKTKQETTTSNRKRNKKTIIQRKIVCVPKNENSSRVKDENPTTTNGTTTAHRARIEERWKMIMAIFVCVIYSTLPSRNKVSRCRRANVHIISIDRKIRCHALGNKLTIIWYDINKMNKIQIPLLNLACLSFSVCAVLTYVHQSDADKTTNINNNAPEESKKNFGENRGRTIKIKSKLLRSTFLFGRFAYGV